jgi:hypothetical protein
MLNAAESLNAANVGEDPQGPAELTLRAGAGSADLGPPIRLHQGPRDRTRLKGSL